MRPTHHLLPNCVLDLPKAQQVYSILTGRPIAIQVPDGAGGTEAMDVSSDGSSNGGVAEFVLCIGDDRSDEDMFLAIEHNANTPQSPAEVRACAVHLVAYVCQSAEDSLTCTSRCLVCSNRMHHMD